MNEEPTIRCKFCHYAFGIDLQSYSDHLWRFHYDEANKRVQDVYSEIKRVENIPQ